jgi:tetratricopeptide (TPR) repeat protein
VSRRDFLLQSWRSASLALTPAGFWKFAFADSGSSGLQTSAPEFHLLPHYRSRLPLETMLQRVEAGSDQFTSEKYAKELEGIVKAWSAELRESPIAIDAIQKSLTQDFSGTSLVASESRQLRSGAIEIWKETFSNAPLARDAFLQNWQTSLSRFSQMLTAEFQITAINMSLPRVQTEIRYDLVGSSKNSYREQRTGYWHLEWEQSSAGGFRVSRWTASHETRSRAASRIFADITAAALGNNSSYNDQLLHGSDFWRTIVDGACGIDVYGHNGISVGDIDNDGFDDLYICQPAGLPNRLYRNRGNGKFEDTTQRSGVGILDNTSCALFADIDNDGHQDLIVVCTSGPLLFANQGDGTFRQQPNAFRFASPPQGTFTGAAIADYDRDGWLDIYFCLYNFYQGTDQYRYPLPYYDANNGPPNFMMRNNRDRSFRDVTAEAGLDQNNTRYSFCCGWNDYNRDGWPDLYVVNDFGRKNLYRNNGNGTFTDVAPELGAEDVGAGMSVCWFDYNNDGAEDLYVGNMWTAAGERISTQDIFKKDSPTETRTLYQKHAMGNSLLLNNDNRFQDVTQSAGAAMGRWAWSSDAWDFDHDGFLDLYIANGMVSGLSKDDLTSFFWRQTVADSPDEAKPAHEYEQGWNAINDLIRSDSSWSGYERNVFYANNHDGTFSDISGVVGIDFVEDGRSFALADFDRDGLQELFLKNRNAPQLRLLKNVMSELAPSVSFRLKGTKSNRDAIGAVVMLEVGDHQQTRSLQAGSGFLCQHSKEIFFGLGEFRGPIKATIRWPSGLVQELENLPANHSIWVEESSPVTRNEPFSVRSHNISPSKNPKESPQLHPPVAGEPQPLPNEIETWLLSPIAAPDFSLPDLTGTLRTLSEFRGKLVLLHFWISAQPNSRELLRKFNDTAHAWSARNVQLLAVNVDEPDKVGQVERLAKESRISFPVLRASEDIAAIYNILFRYLYDRHRDLTLPTSFLVDEKGEIVKVYQGAIDPAHIDGDFSQIPQTQQERLSKALPFSGITDTTEFTRNYLSFGSIFFQRGYYDQAIASFERAFHDNPTSAEALYGVGSIYLQRKQNVEAREAFDRVTRLQASYPDTLPNAWNNLGILAAREGQIAEAVPYFQQALKLSPDHLVALENLGNAYRQQKRLEDARQLLEHAVAVGPDDPEANYGLGMVYAQLDDTERAFDYLQRALKFRPDYPEALNNLGVLYMRSNRRDEAAASFQESIRVAPAFDQSYLNLARVYVIENSPDKARTVLLDLLKQHPEHPLAKTMLQELESR